MKLRQYPLIFSLFLISFGNGITYGQDLFWEATASPADTVIALLFDAATGTLFYGSNDFDGNRNVAFRSADGGTTWEEMTGNLSASQFESFVVSPNGDLFASTGDGVYRYDPTSGQWGETGLSVPFLTTWSLITDSEGRLFAGTHGPVWVGSAGIFRSTDEGTTWSRAVDGLSMVEGRISDIFAFAVDANDTVYAGTSGGLYRSTDHGDTWTLLGLEDEGVNAVVLHPDSTLWVSSRNGFFRSNDNGATWTNTLNRDGQALILNADGDLFAASADTRTLGGTFRLLNGATMWEDISQGLPTRKVFALAFDAEGQLFAGTENGVYRSIEPTVTAIEHREGEIPQIVTLESNYPNPFRTTTTLSFSLRETGTATLKIYDLWGRAITTLVHEMLPAGRHKVTWDAAHQANGIYVAKLIIDAAAQTHPMVLLK